MNICRSTLLLVMGLWPIILHAANPIMPGADPHVLVLSNTIWVYPTWNDIRRSQRFFTFSSTNLTDWQRHGPVLDFKDVDWIDDDGQRLHYAWAPSVLAANGKFYLYYSVGPQDPTPSRIGVAVGDAPAGPFRDSGKPLLTGGNGFEAIDPMVFPDPQSARTYFYAGGSAGAKLRVFEMQSRPGQFCARNPGGNSAQIHRRCVHALPPRALLSLLQPRWLAALLLLRSLRHG